MREKLRQKALSLGTEAQKKLDAQNKKPRNSLGLQGFGDTVMKEERKDQPRDKGCTGTILPVRPNVHYSTSLSIVQFLFDSPTIHAGRNQLVKY